MNVGIKEKYIKYRLDKIMKKVKVRLSKITTDAIINDPILYELLYEVGKLYNKPTILECMVEPFKFSINDNPIELNKE